MSAPTNVIQTPLSGTSSATLSTTSNVPYCVPLCRLLSASLGAPSIALTSGPSTFHAVLSVQ